MAEITISFLLDQLKPLLIEEAKLLGCVGQEVVHIKEELEKMKDFLRVVDTKKETDKQLRKRVLQVQDVANDVEDVLDEFTLRLGHDHGDGCYGFLCKMVGFFWNLKARHQIASELRKLKSRVEDLSKDYPAYRIPDPSSSSTVISNTCYDGRGDALLIEEADLVGIEKPKQQLISWLLDGDSRLKAVSVVGMGGLGKTTLVKRVFEDTQVKRQFQAHAWVTVSQSFDIVKLLKDIIKELQAHPEGVETMSDIELKAAVKEFLQERRYVVVLDDIWSIDDWDAIKLAFPDRNCCSRVLLTTRVHEVASASCFDFRGSLYEMKALSDEESWTLFCQKTFEDKRCPQNLEELSRNVLRKCEGLPLAIVAIGGVLALKKSITEWEMILRELRAEDQDEGKIGRMKKILSLSYNDLPYHLKICFIYLSIYPEDCIIFRKEVIRLWTSLRLVQESQIKTPTEVADNYINQLLNRSLIQLVSSTSVEKPQIFRIHDLLRDIIVSKSREHYSEQDVDYLPDKVRHLAFHDFKGLQQQQRMHFLPLRSLLMFFADNSESVLSMFPLLFGCCKLLKVLYLRFGWLMILPDDVSKLRHLKYLCIRHSKLKTIPKSIGELQNLEILDLTWNSLSCLPVEIGNLGKLEILDLSDNMDLELPVEIGKLQKLRDLCVGFKTEPLTIPSAIENLSSLQKLHTISAYKKNGNIVTGEIEKLTQLKTLHIAKLRREDGVALCSALRKLTKLGSLTACSNGGGDDIIDLSSLHSAPPLLRKLNLYGLLERIPHWISSLYSLVKVTFGFSHLQDDPLQCLQDLPNLQYLDLFRAFSGEELCFKAGGFSRLKVLRFRILEKLRWVKIEQGAMPDLARMSIDECKQLEDVPSGIEHLTKLRVFELYQMDQFSEIGHPSKLAHIPHVILEMDNH